MTSLVALAREALIAGRLEDAGKAITDHYGGEATFEFRCERLSSLPPSVVYCPHSAVKWLVDSRRSVITLDAGWQERGEYLSDRLFGTFPLIAEYQRIGREHGVVYLNLDDLGIVPGLVFCAYADNEFPIPDPVFLVTEGYKIFREQLAREPVP